MSKRIIPVPTATVPPQVSTPPQKGKRQPADAELHALKVVASETPSAPGSFCLRAMSCEERVLAPDEQGEPPHWLVFRCPCGCGKLGRLRLDTAMSVRQPKWQWDGSTDEATVVPAVYVPSCGYSGSLTRGTWRGRKD